MQLDDLIAELIDERSLEALERLTGSRHEDVLEALVEAAGEILASDEADEADDDILEGIRYHLIECKAVGLLIDALQSSRPETREFALGCLGESRESRAVPAMIQLLKDPEPSVKEAAAEHLALLTNYDFGADPEKWKEWFAKKVQGEAEQAEEDREDEARMLRLQLRGQREPGEGEGDEGDDR